MLQLVCEEMRRTGQVGRWPGPCPEAPAWDARPPASHHLLPVDPLLGGGPRPLRGLQAASRCRPSRGPGRRAVGVRRGPRSPPCTGAWVCLPRGGQCPPETIRKARCLPGGQAATAGGPRWPERGPVTPPELRPRCRALRGRAAGVWGPALLLRVRWAPVHLQGTCCACCSEVGSWLCGEWPWDAHPSTGLVPHRVLCPMLCTRCPWMQPGPAVSWE